ncbi:carbamoyltransferase HypF [Falsiroseomonas oryzae]|uniref:carbamoyltransferase HypF n=1 Tax=Falsiroseomonas oryzae TaxID=2766473 RepID=UPI0022EB76ED|nr:carbamoyltransferase HypF [Roseomonas sp. MO-31]
MAEPGALIRRVEVRVRGVVQGVGFRPAVWQAATALGLDGDVRNDGEGVLIRAAGAPAAVEALLARLRDAPPSLSDIVGIEVADTDAMLPRGFAILESDVGTARTAVAPDAATCADCAAEIADPAARRFRYPFATCTRCGPRFTIVEALPFDRARTTMAGFPLCADCAAEYAKPSDRRFHAEAVACPACGPRLAFDAQRGEAALQAAIALLRRGGILAVKGLGGYQLACDATDAEAVARLRGRKRRETKPFALMARDLDAVRRLCLASEQEAALLASAPAPIVLLRRRHDASLPEAVAPGLDTLGVMLPTTPLHRLLLEGFDVPLVMTSGNLSDAPPETDDAQARERLGTVADGFLSHDRPIAMRVDDSVARVLDGRPRLLRRARGYAPAPVTLRGFDAPPVVALGGQQKAALCLLRGAEAILSHHIGELDEATAAEDFERAIAHYAALFRHQPAHVAVDLHPGYRSAALGRALAERHGATLHAVQHHHAHIAACLAENGVLPGAPPVLGVALDGLGYGADGSLWGNELLLCDYRDARRVGTLRAAALPGGDAASREPWRNLFAQLELAFGWSGLLTHHDGLPIVARLAAKPVASLAAMIRQGVNAPPASSCGRLFDAVAAALGLGFDRVGHEGEAAARLEALARDTDDRVVYPIGMRHDGVPALDPAPMWAALLDDLARGVTPSAIASRFHRGLALAIVELGAAVAPEADVVALSGGCLQNPLLHRLLVDGFAAQGRQVLTQARVPANDGGLALGQAAIVAARLMG